MSKRSNFPIRYFASLVLLGFTVSGCSTIESVIDSGPSGTSTASSGPAVASKAAPASMQAEAKPAEPAPVPKAAAEKAPEKVKEASANPAPEAGTAPAPAAAKKPVVAVAPVSSAVPAPIAKKAPSADEFKNLPPNTFIVHSVDKDASHPFYNKGSKLGFSVNGVQGKALVVQRGKTYTIRVDTNIQHDFYLATKAVGRGGFTLAKGVKGNFLYEGDLIFKPDASTPDTAYYACRNHPYMGGPIFVTNDIAHFDLAKAVADWKASMTLGAGPRRGAKTVVSEAQAKRKVGFAAMYIRQSAAARRIENGADATAKKMLADARQDLDRAEAAMKAKDYSRAAGIANAAMKLMSDAGRLAPAEDVTDNRVARTQYKELRDGILTYRKSYARHLKRLTKSGSDMTDVPKVDLAKVDASIDRARKLADAEDYDQASRILTVAQKDLTTALTAMLKSKTLSYELKFDEPKDEYEYEVSRFKSYEELIPLAIEQKRPSKAIQGLMRKSVDRGQEIAEQARPVAARGDYKTAIQMMQGATSHVQRALRMLGIR